MIKYGIVGAIALAVLVTATWDGKKKTDVAKTDPKVESPPDSTVSGEVGTPKGDSIKPPTGSQACSPPIEPSKEPPKPVEEEFLKHQVKKGETIKSIAKSWLGDEKLAQELYEFNKDRIPDVRKLNSHLTLVFPKSKLPSGKAAEVGTAGSTLSSDGSVAAGMKKDEAKPTEVPAGDKKYVVKSGDTLYGIAARELGKGSRWKEILKLNDLSTASLKTGQSILLPSK
jgi:nucleoid-associated protein YgaU